MHRYCIVGVLDYFDNNWRNISQEWVRYRFTKHHMYSNATNNRTESVNQKLKAVIAKYSSLPVFFRELMGCISSIRTEQDIHAAELLMRLQVGTNYEPHDNRYYKLLTEFAFDLYYEESKMRHTVRFVEVHELMAVFGSMRGQRLMASGQTCDCEFFMSMNLPCRHILAFREINEMFLFEPFICAERWFKSKMNIISHSEYVLDDTPNVEIIATQSEETRLKRTSNQKYRKLKSKCDELCTLMSELPEEQYKTMYNSLDNLLKSVRNLANADEGKMNIVTFLYINSYRFFFFTETHQTATDNTADENQTAEQAESSVQQGTDNIEILVINTI